MGDERLAAARRPARCRSSPSSCSRWWSPLRARRAAGRARVDPSRWRSRSRRRSTVGRRGLVVEATLARGFPADGGPIASVGLLVDCADATAMLVLVTLVSLLVQIYSLALSPRRAAAPRSAGTTPISRSSPSRCSAWCWRPTFSRCSCSGSWSASARTCSSATGTTRPTRRAPRSRRSGSRSSATSASSIGIVLLWSATGTFEFTRLLQSKDPTLPSAGLRADHVPASTSAPWASRRSSRCTSGCPTRWRARRPSRRSSTPRRWSPPASICVTALEPLFALVPERRSRSSPGSARFTALLAATHGVRARATSSACSRTRRSRQLGYMMAAVGRRRARGGLPAPAHARRRSRRSCSSPPARSSTPSAPTTSSAMGGLFRRDAADGHRLHRRARWPSPACRRFAGFFSKEAVLGGVWEAPSHGSVPDAARSPRC